MNRDKHLASVAVILALVAGAAVAVTRDHRWPPRGPWMWRLERELPQLFREFNAIDFGHAHLGDTLLETQAQDRVERARLDVVDVIFHAPPVPPDEEMVAPRFTRMVWPLYKTFNWTHELHRSIYDIYASRIADKDAAIKSVIADYLEKPEAITPHMLDHMGKLWSFPESKAFSSKFRKFNTQIWAYHWLQGGVYDIQLMGGPERQRELMPRIIEHYHGYIRQPPEQWQFMPMISESSPDFARRFPDAAAIFDNLHMLHDNADDVLSRPDLYPTFESKRDAILRILEIYLNANHSGTDRYAEYHMPMKPGLEGGHGGHSMAVMGPRPPSARMVLEGHTGDVMPAGGEHGGHGGGGPQPGASGHQGHGESQGSAPRPQPGAGAHPGHAGSQGSAQKPQSGAKAHQGHGRSQGAAPKTGSQGSGHGSH